MIPKALIRRQVAPLCLLFLGMLPACEKGRDGRADAGAVWWYSSLDEAKINADAVLDFVGICTDPEPKASPRVCAVDGAMFAILWRSEPLVDVGDVYMLKFGVAGDKVALIDALAILHVYDLHTGKELQTSHRFGERAKRLCSPREHPDKLWIETEGRAGWMFDPATMEPTPASQPRSCLFSYCWLGSIATVNTPECPVPVVSGWTAITVGVKGEDGFAVLSSDTGKGMQLAGFTPGTPALRWMHTIPPIEPLRARPGSVDYQDVSFHGGRAVSHYDDLSGARHIVALDAKTGDLLWDVISKEPGQVISTETRVYELIRPRLNVRDAATGKLLGGVGAPNYHSAPR